MLSRKLYGGMLIMLALAFSSVGAWALSVGDELPVEQGLFLEVPDEDSDVRLNVQVVDNNFRVYFVDLEDKLVAPLRTKLVIRYETLQGRERETIPLSVGPGGAFLTSPRYVQAPFLYRMWVLYPEKVGGEDYYTYPMSMFSQGGSNE